MSNFTKIREIKPELLDAPTSPKSSTSSGGGTYTRMYYKYEGGEPLFQLFGKGSVRMSNKYGRDEWKLNFFLSEDEDVQGLAKLDAGRAACIAKHKNMLKLYDFNPEAPGSIFRGSYFQPRDKDGNATSDNYMMSIKIVDNDTTISNSNNKSNNKSTFEALVDEEGGTEVLDYKQLEGKDLEFSLVFYLRDEYKGSGNPSPQIFVRNCVLLKIVDRGKVDQTKSDEVMRYLQSDPELLNNLAEQLKQLKVGNASSLLQTPSVSEGEPGQMTQTSGSESGQMPQIATVPNPTSIDLSNYLADNQQQFTVQTL